MGGMKFFTGVLVGLMTALALPASADAPALPANHPKGTIGPVFKPVGCTEVKRMHFEERMTSRIDVMRAVREVYVIRLECRSGDRHRTLVARGPWQPAYVTQ